MAQKISFVLSLRHILSFVALATSFRVFLDLKQNLNF